MQKLFMTFFLDFEFYAKTRFKRYSAIGAFPRIRNSHDQVGTSGFPRKWKNIRSLHFERLCGS